MNISSSAFYLQYYLSSCACVGQCEGIFYLFNKIFHHRAGFHIFKFNPANCHLFVVSFQRQGHDVLFHNAVNETACADVVTVCVGDDVVCCCTVAHIYNLFKARNINYIGAEVLFRTDNDEVCSPEFIDMMHGDGKLVWVNSIIYNVRDQIAAGHSDDTALTESMEKGWGWLADRGFDIIQTDWPLMLINYLKETNRYFK